MLTIGHKKNVIQLAEKYNYDKTHAEFVEKMSLLIFDKTTTIHNLTKSSKILLSHAALLHDIGQIINYKKHHKHSQYLILNDGNFCYPNNYKESLSLIVRNHRKKVIDNLLDTPEINVFEVLTLSSILRVADSLYVENIEISIKKILIRETEISIVINYIEEIDHLRRFEKKKDLFERIFKYKLNLLSEKE